MRRREAQRVILWSLLLSLAGLSPATAKGPLVPAPMAAEGLAVARALPLPVLAAQHPTWTPGLAPHQLIDDFEAAAWPDPSIWAAVLDLSGRDDAPITWGPRECRAASGRQSLWAIGGGDRGRSLPCGNAFPHGQVSSAVLALDLRPLHAVAELWLSFDLWADAAPNEGLLISVLEADTQGNPSGRRIVYSATGHSASWARGVKLDLVRLIDRFSGREMDARGQYVLLEFLFLGLADTPDAEGIYLDNLALSSREATPIVVTPVPEADQTMGCSGGTDCGSLSVRAYVDSRCDGRYQPGIDALLPGTPRVTVTTGSIILRSHLTTSGSAFFRLPYSEPVVAELGVPEGYVMCSNSRQSVTLRPRDFQPFGRAKVEFRLQRAR